MDLMHAPLSGRRTPALLALLLAALAPATQVAAQDSVSVVRQASPGFASPRATMFTFLSAVNAVAEGSQEAFRTALNALNLSGAGIDPTSEQARRTARDLWSALNRIREVEPSELPSIEELGTSETRFVYFPRPFNPVDEGILERVDVGDAVIAFERLPDGQWLFSAQTVAGASGLSRALAALPQQVAVDEAALDEPLWVQQTIPQGLRTGGFFGLRPWQWLGLAVILFLGLVTDLALRTLLAPLGRRTFKQLRGRLAERHLQETTRAVGLFATAIVWSSLIRLLVLPDPIGAIALSATGVFAVLAGAFMGWKLTDLGGEYLLHRARKTESRFDDILVPLLRKTAKLFVVALAIIYGAQNLNINIVPLLTGLGIGGLAFAFAAKDTIENLFGSVAVVLDRPFEVGDWVMVGDVEGTVEELGFRSTRIRTFYNSQVTIANATLVRATVDNYGRRQYRRWKTTIGVQYDTAPDKLLAFTEGIRELIRRHPFTRKDYYQIWCNDFADSSLNIMVYMFFEVPDWSTELRERERLFVDIVRLADQLGVQFAFPTRTLHLYREEHAPPKTAHDVPRTTTEHEAFAAGARAAREITEQQPWRRRRPGPVTFTIGRETRGDSETGGDG